MKIDKSILHNHDVHLLKKYVMKPEKFKTINYSRNKKLKTPRTTSLKRFKQNSFHKDSNWHIF